MKIEIVYCNLTVMQGTKKVVIRGVVYKERDGYYSNKKHYPEPMKVVNVEKIKSMGFTDSSD